MKYCAFLRGVNVKGTAMKMAEAVELFKKQGLIKVSSILATGNILFESEENPLKLRKMLEKALSEYFDYEAFARDLFINDYFSVEADSQTHVFYNY